MPRTERLMFNDSWHQNISDPVAYIEINFGGG